MNAIEILNTARKRSSWTAHAFQAVMQDLSDLEGMRNDITIERVSGSSTKDQLADIIARYDEHIETFCNAAKDSEEAVRAAENVIRGIANNRWQRVLTMRFIAQMGWLEIAEALHITDDAAKKMCKRALENLAI